MDHTTTRTKLSTQYPRKTKGRVARQDQAWEVTDVLVVGELVAEAETRLGVVVRRTIEESIGLGVFVSDSNVQVDQILSIPLQKRAAT